jgi:hypothetical protein
MKYLHDNLRMHIVCGGKMQYPHSNLNPHYISEKKTLYLHDKMQTVCGVKM